jgi:protein AbiQ
MGLELYNVSERYCKYLKQYDRNTPFAIKDKNNRPFIGVLLSIKEINYFAPLFSPKAKHKKMNDRKMLDLIKLGNGELGVINLNNMIPIPLKVLSKIDFHIQVSDSNSTKQYKTLLKTQYEWCKENRSKIIKKADILYNRVVKGRASQNLIRRCCNFKLLEQKCKDYEQMQTKEKVKEKKPKERER